MIERSGHAHLQQAALSDEDTERDPPIPAPPIYETVTWEDPPPKSTVGPPARGDMKKQALNPIQRVPSRRGSLVDAGAPQISDHPGTTIPPQLADNAVPSIPPCKAAPPTVPAMGHVSPGNDSSGRYYMFAPTAVGVATAFDTCHVPTDTCDGHPQLNIVPRFHTSPFWTTSPPSCHRRDRQRIVVNRRQRPHRTGFSGCIG